MTEDVAELRDRWLAKALERAGIDARHWKPNRGIDANLSTVEAVYRYYGKLFLEHPVLQWAGMANLIGPAFYAAFRDLGAYPDAARHAVLLLLGRRKRELEDDIAGELGFYETTFLTMQKKIFEDQAPMHEAYLAGGAAEIERFWQAGIIDTPTLVGWRQIDKGTSDGDADLLRLGNRALLMREQRDIIDHFYRRMLGRHPPLGLLFTYLMTMAGAPSIPASHSYAERYPATLRASLLRSALWLRTPFPDGDVAVFANRWMLIEEDTLPAYIRLITSYPEQARKIVSSSVATRMRSFRLIRRIGKIASALFTHWQLSRGPAAKGVIRRERTQPATSTGTTRLTLDLRQLPPTLMSQGTRSSQVWMNRDGSPIAVDLRLPDRSHRLDAQMVVLLADAPAAQSGSLSIQMPRLAPGNSIAALEAYAREWRFQTHEAAQWTTDELRRAPGHREYSTHVIRAARQGPVTIEFQLAYHVRDRALTITAILSW
jgi:hypothetical protein